MRYLIIIVMLTGCTTMSIDEKKCALKYPNYNKEQRIMYCHKFDGFREVW